MKSNITIVALLFYAWSYAQQVQGFDTSDFDTEVSSRANYLVGVKVHSDNAGVLNAINLVGNATGSGVQMSLYKDDNNRPGELIAVSEKGYVGDNTTSLGVVPTEILSGDYWVMTVYEEAGYHAYTKMESGDNDVFYAPMIYGNAPPTDATDFASYKGHDFAYFLSMNAESNDNKVGGIEQDEISVFPNPMTDYVYVTSVKGAFDVEVIDLLGNVQKSVYSASKQLRLDMSNLHSGVYFIVVDSSVVIEIIKD